MPSNNSFERIVRTIGDPLIPREPKRQEPVQEEGEAVLEWSANTRVNQTVMPGRTWSIAPKNQEDEREEEEDRVIREERIENPDDPDQYVIVEVIDEIVFRGADGRLRRYVLKNE